MRLSQLTLPLALLSTLWLAPASASAREPDLAKAEEKKADDKKADEKVKKVTLARFLLKEDYPEGTVSPGLFGELQPRLSEVIQRLDKASKDDKIAGVILAIRSPNVGLGKVEELRAAIGRLRKSNKKVYADVHSAMTKDFLIASACDEIIMPPSGDLMITGLQAQVMFFKGLFTKLGIEADFIQIGDFKGASEPFTRTQMSPEFRQQFESVVDDFYQQMVKTIAADRKLEPTRVKELIDEGLLMADQAKQAKLIDRVCYEDELQDQLKQSLNAEEVVIAKDYGKKKLDTDFSGLGGFMKLMELMMGVEPSAKSSKGPKIAVVYAVGAIMTGENSSGPFGGESTVGSDTMVKALRQAADDATVKAIVLRVDSPGGSALASDLIWREIVRSKKPVIASMGDTAASGGYYISMGASKIFAEPGTLTGSIGVVSGKLALRGLLDKIGVTTEVITRGKNAGALSSTDPFTPDERAAWKRMMTEVYKQFTGKAAEGRKMKVEKLEQLAGGRLFSGRMAVENGLVDKLGTLEDAIGEAKSMGGLKAEDKVDLLILPKTKNFFEQLFEGPSVEAQSRVALPILSDGLREIETLRKLFASPSPATVLPFKVEIR